uniref:Uncharacterized protein n=1 Tax=Chlamydomonas euryale TaxID=1486919 RepID=A0A7R9V629_9CHLO
MGTTAASPRRDHLYAHMTYRAVSDTERSVLSHTYDDGRHHKKRHMAEPGSGGPAQGPDMLHHKPDVRIACYVPFGGLAQQQPSRRTVAPTVTADTLSTSLRR